MRSITNYLLISTILVITSCANLVCNFDQNSYVAATVLKQKSLKLIAFANEPAISHESEILELQSEFEAQLAYEQGKGKSNWDSYQQWKILVDPQYDLLGKMLKEWRDSSNGFPADYVKAKSEQISWGFDEIIRLEASKPH